MFEEAQRDIDVFSNKFKKINKGNFSCFSKNCDEELINTSSSPHLAHVVSFKDIKKVVKTFFDEDRPTELEQFVKYLTELDVDAILYDVTDSLSDLIY